MGSSEGGAGDAGDAAGDVSANGDTGWVSMRVAPSHVDRQIDEMIADPLSYFVESRERARREARHYVTRRLRGVRPARPA